MVEENYRDTQRQTTLVFTKDSHLFTMDTHTLETLAHLFTRDTRILLGREILYLLDYY